LARQKSGLSSRYTRSTAVGTLYRASFTWRRPRLFIFTCVACSYCSRRKSPETRRKCQQCASEQGRSELTNLSDGAELLPASHETARAAHAVTLADDSVLLDHRLEMQVNRQRPHQELIANSPFVPPRCCASS
jgi:hypothetical protein